MSFIKSTPIKLLVCFRPSFTKHGLTKLFGIIIKITKKGNLRDCDNWRGICVLPGFSKIIAKEILERIRDPLISTVDAGLTFVQKQRTKMNG